MRHLTVRSLPLAALASAVVAGAQVPVNSLCSRSTSGTQSNETSYYSLLSPDGRYVVFQSSASNLVAGDFNGRQDIFRHDLATATTELVSVALTGNSGNGIAVQPDVSQDGRYVVWSTDASNLVTGDTNGTWDVFLRDMVAGTTTLLSRDHLGNLASARSDGPRITPDGRYVVFESDADLVPADSNGLKDVYRLDRQTSQLTLVSVTAAGVQGDGWSYHGAISHDGRRIVFTSGATTLVAGDTNNQVDMFLKDLVTGTLTRVNVSSTGVQANNESTWPSISGNGEVVTFCSAASNLIPVDTSGNWDLFAYDVATATTTRLNVQPNGLQANSYVRSPTGLSFDGSLVVFASLSTNLVAGDTNGKQDIFLRDRAAGVTSRVSLDTTGGEPDGDSFVPHMTPDGRVVTYTSDASDLVAGDSNGRRDIFAANLDPTIPKYGARHISSVAPGGTRNTVPGTIFRFRSGGALKKCAWHRVRQLTDEVKGM
jgi:Tol biopolymer transport system component